MSDWNYFRGNPQQTAHTQEPGPVEGRIVWRRQLGRQWYSAPLVDGDRIFCACPGRIGRKLICLDHASGETVWETEGLRSPADGELPAAVRLASRLIDAGDSILVRALNHDGIFRFAKSDGRVVEKLSGDGILDYRSHPQPLFGGDDDYLLYPEGTRSHAGADPNRTDTGVWTHLVCRDMKRGRRLWRFRTGQFFAEPVAGRDKAFVGTAEGILYALHLEPEDRESTQIGSSAVRRIAWSYRARGAFNSTPLLYEGVVYAGCNDGTVYAFDADSGELCWRFDAGEMPPETYIAFSPPATDGASLFIGDARGKAYSLSLKDGKLVGSYTLNEWIRARPGYSDGELALAGMDGTLALFAAGGEELWRRKVSDYLLCSEPLIVGDTVFIVDSGLILHAINRSNGGELWSAQLVDYPRDWVAFDEFQSSPQIADSRLFLGTPGRFLQALSTETGEPLWRFETGGEIASDPVIFEGRVYFGQQGGEGVFFCAEAATGRILWKQRLGRVWAAANFADGRLFVAGAEGVAYALDAESGAILWRYPTGSDLYVAPVLTENLVCFGAWDQWLYALDQDSGELVWRFHAETYLDSGAAAVGDGKLYLPTMGPRFYCLDPADGRELWRYVPNPGWTTNASPALAEGRVVMTVFLSGKHPYAPYEIETRCLDGGTGELIWSFPSGGLNGPVVAKDKVYFASTIRGDYGFYCLDLAGNGDGTTELCYRLPLGFNVLESCIALQKGAAYAYAEDGYLSKIR